jgi:hypothetical protein
MYTTKNFKTKKELKEAVAAFNALVERRSMLQPVPVTDEIRRNVIYGCRDKGVTLYAPGLGEPVYNGWETVEGPHYPEPHRWYAQVEVVDGIVVKVR